jgi:spore germination cell wall hydrolase CwlJ-like protein
MECFVKKRKHDILEMRAFLQRGLAAIALATVTILLAQQVSSLSGDRLQEALRAVDYDFSVETLQATDAMDRLFTGPVAFKGSGETYDQARQCLAQAIYFEARSEPAEGWVAVADVVLNRARDPRFPASICGVVFQGEYRRHKCQFSFACDGVSDTAYNQRLWEKALRLASYKLATLSEEPSLTEATHYHADYVDPYWSSNMTRLAKIGRHIFYTDLRN